MVHLQMVTIFVLVLIMWWLTTIFSICFQSKDNEKLVAVKNIQTVSSPNLHVSDLETIPCHSKENQLAKNAAPDLDRTG